MRRPWIRTTSQPDQSQTNDGEERILPMIACHEEIRNELRSKNIEFGGIEIENARWIDDVLRRAYQIHRQHGGIFGYDLEDWLQAEREFAEAHGPLYQTGDSTLVKASSH